MNDKTVLLQDYDGEDFHEGRFLVCALSVGIARDVDEDQSEKIIIQSALAASQGKGLFFPSGRYRIDSNVTLSSKGWLVGSQKDSTIFYSNSKLAPIVGEDTYSTVVSDIVICDIIFDNVIVKFHGNRKSDIKIIYNVFINSRTDSSIAQISVAHTSFLIKGNVLMRERNCPGVGINTYRNTDTIVSYNFLGSLIEINKAKSYLDDRTLKLIERLTISSGRGDITIADDQGNYVCAWYATDGLTRSSFYNNFIAGNKLQHLYNINSHEFNITRDHIIYIKQYDDVDVYLNYFTGWPDDAHGQLKFRNAKNLIFAANYLEMTSFNARPYDNSPHLYMINTFIFNNFINDGVISFWQNFDDSEIIKIEVLDFLVFRNDFIAKERSEPRITSTYRNSSENFFSTFSSNMYIDDFTEVNSIFFKDIKLGVMENKIPERKKHFLNMHYILPCTS